MIKPGAASAARPLLGFFWRAIIEAAAWIGHAARKEGLGGDNDLLRRNRISQTTGHANSRYPARPASMLAAESVHPGRRILTSARTLSVANRLTGVTSPNIEPLCAIARLWCPGSCREAWKRLSRRSGRTGRCRARRCLNPVRVTQGFNVGE